MSPRLSPPASPNYGQNLSGYFANAGLPDGGSNSDSGSDSVSAVPMAGTSFWDNPSLNIEFSQEAEALATYFNQGGIGGITALDLGFSYEPTLYPDHIFEPRPAVSNPAKNVTSGRFAACYLSPWQESLPPPSKLEQFAVSATERILPRIPLIHEATIDFGELSTHTVYALAVAGGAYDAEEASQSFAGVALCLKRVYLVKSFHSPDNTDEMRFHHLQSMLLYQLVGFYRDEQHRVEAFSFHRALCQMFWELNLVEKVQKAEPVVAGDLTGLALDVAWKQWVKTETRRRVAFIVYLLDLEVASHFKTSPLLSFTELDIDLPASEALWKAKDAPTWAALQRSTTPAPSPNVHFLSAVRALLAAETLSPFSPDGLVLTSLAQLEALPLMVLSRSLTFLHDKSEEALAKADPFRRTDGLFPTAKRAETRDGKELLRRIKQARTFMQDFLPGGQARGGGEGWFEEVLPSPPAPNVSIKPGFVTEGHKAALRDEARAAAADFPTFLGSMEAAGFPGAPQPLYAGL